MSLIAAAIQQDGLTFMEVVRNVPHDGPAILVYIMMALLCAFIWHGSRTAPTAAGGDRQEPGREPAEPTALS